MRFRSFSSILDECLAAVQQGETVETCLARYPRQAHRLKPLLTLTERVRRTPHAQPRPWAQTTAWNTIRQRAADLRAGKRRTAASPFRMSYGWLKPVAFVLALFFAVGATGGATAFAAQDALPNDTLYPVKLFTEDVHVWITFDDTSRASLLLDQSDERMQEIATLVSHGQPIPENVLSSLQDRNERATNILEDRPQETVLWDRALKQAQSQEHVLIALWGQVEPDARAEYTQAVADVHNTQLAGTDSAVARIQPEDLAGGIRTISGTVDTAEDGIWTVGGVQIRVDERTIGQQGITPGSSASFVVGRGGGGRLYALSASLIQTGASPTQAVVSGQIEEVRDDAVRMNGQWYKITSDSLLKTPLRIGQTVALTLNKTDAGPQVSSAEAVTTGGASATFIYEGNIEGDPTTDSEEWTIGGLTFTESSSTQLDLTGGAAGDGARALVEATSDGRTLMAQRIAILSSSAPDNQVYLVGLFEGSRNGTWIVSGQELEPKDNAQEPQSGSLVAIDATQGDGALTVKQSYVIRAPDAPSLSRFIGTAITIEDTTWTTETGEVRVASRSTTVSGRPLEGARAIIWYRPGTDGALQASYVHVLDQHPVLQAPEPTPTPDQGQ